jgi:hypothetical protein
MAVGTVDGMPLGMLDVHSWQRDDSKPSPTKLRKLGHSQQEVREMPSEMDRWFEGILAAEKALGKPGTLIHVADSESDDYRLMALLNENNCRFVLRGTYDRRIVDSEHRRLKARLLVEESAVARPVKVKPRVAGNGVPSNRNPPRPGRVANLEIRAARVTLQRPKLAGRGNTLEVNVVHVTEVNPPPGQAPIEWILLTSEPIDTTEAILAVVDIYRRRWLIEEFFKVLKTGCSYEARQLESFETFTNALALFMPVAWGLLRLRALERTNSNMRSEACFTPDQLAALRAKTGKPLSTVTDAMRAIAQMGGHIRNNGQPGWLVLWRGFRDLLLLAQGFALARKSILPYNDQS